MKKARLGLIALALMVSAGAAFANKSHVKSGDPVYGVTGFDEATNSYIVTTASGSCTMSSNVCDVASPVPPNGSSEISVDDVTGQDQGTFH